MEFRSHLLRALDVKVWSNRWIMILTPAAFALGLALVLVADASPWLLVATPATTFLNWAIAREIDPDRQLTAVVAAVLGATWVLIGFEVALAPLLGMLIAGRLLVESTGRRPLLTDLIPVAMAAAAISFTPAGWATGFGVALAIYVDDRLSDEPSNRGVITAVAAALGSSAVATLTDAFPRRLPEIQPFLALALGLLALLAVVREPPDPTTQVDSRLKTFLVPQRLHAARVSVGLILFAAALLSGEDGAALVPGAVALSLSLASSEVERIQRAR